MTEASEATGAPCPWRADNARNGEGIEWRRPKRAKRRDPQGPLERVGGNSGSDSVVTRNIGYSFLKCGIAEVGQTYLWP